LVEGINFIIYLTL